MSVLGQSAPTVIPVDDSITEEMYPGYAPAFGSQPFVFEPVRPFAGGRHGARSVGRRSRPGFGGAGIVALGSVRPPSSLTGSVPRRS